nr:hypothetical protein CFP56_24015 [Quercus suber]
MKCGWREVGRRGHQDDVNEESLSFAQGYTEVHSQSGWSMMRFRTADLVIDGVKAREAGVLAEQAGRLR